MSEDLQACSSQECEMRGCQILIASVPCSKSLPLVPGFVPLDIPAITRFAQASMLGLPRERTLLCDFGAIDYSTLSGKIHHFGHGPKSHA